MTAQPPAASPSVPSARLCDWKIGGLLLLVVLAIEVLFMPARIWSADPAIWRHEALAIVQHGRLWIEPAVAASTGSRGEYFVLNPVDGHYYSKFGLFNTVMALPPMLAERLLTGKFPTPADPNVLILNSWNILISLLLALALYRLAARYAPNPWLRVLYVLACFFATYLWYYQRAQESEIDHALFFTLACACIFCSFDRPGLPSPRWALLAWLFVAMLVFSRIVYGIFLPWMIAVYIIATIARGQNPRRILPVLFIPALAILALLGLVNDLKFGSPFLTGYEQWPRPTRLPPANVLNGVCGLLFSVHWSVFIYFPLLLLALPRLRRFAAAFPLDAGVILSAFVLILLVLGSLPTWRGEWSYGPRYMLFILPMAATPALLLAPAPHEARHALVTWTTLALALAILGGSTLLQLRVITINPWFFYLIEQPLEGRMNKEIAEYLLDTHEAVLYQDLNSRREDLDSSFLFIELRERVRINPSQMEVYRRIVLDALDDTDLYWWPPKTPAPGAGGQRDQLGS